MKSLTKSVAVALSLALVATAPGLTPYAALAQTQSLPVGVGTNLPGAPLAQPGTDLGGVSNLPMGSLETMGGLQPLESLGSLAPRSGERAGVRGIAGALSPNGERVGVRGPSSRSASTRIVEAGRVASESRRVSNLSSDDAAAISTKIEEVFAGKLAGKGALEAYGTLSLMSSREPVSAGARSTSVQRSASVRREGPAPRVAVRGLASAPETSGSSASGIVSSALSVVRVALGGAAVLGLHVGAATLLPGLFGFVATPSLVAVASGAALLPVALFARYRLGKVSEHPASRGPRILMDLAIGGYLAAAAAAFPDVVGLAGMVAEKSGGVVSLGPLLGLAALAVTTTMAFFLPFITASIRGPSAKVQTPKVGGTADKHAKKPNWHYGLKTGLIIAAMAGLFAVTGATVFGFKTLGINLLIAGALSFVMFWFSHKIIALAVGGKEAPESVYPELYRIVRELTQKAGAPMPKIYIVPMGVPNAFATGRSPKHAVVGVTPEIMALLTERELRGVLAHEMSHVLNRDMLTSTVLGSMSSAIAFSAWSVLWVVATAKNKGLGLMAWVGSKLRRGKKNGAGSNVAASDPKDGSGQKPEAFDPLTGGIILSQAGGVVRAFAALWAPIIATTIQMAGTRTREFAADHDGGVLSDDPKALASGLAKLMSWRPSPGFKLYLDAAPVWLKSQSAPFTLATSYMFTMSVTDQVGMFKDLRIPRISFPTMLWTGTGVMFGLLSGFSTPTSYVNYAFMAWMFLGSTKWFNYLWGAAFAYSAFTGWTGPLTLVVWAFFAERVTVWTMKLLQRMLPKDGPVREDADEFLFRKFVTHPATTERIDRLNRMAAPDDDDGGSSAPGGKYRLSAQESQAGKGSQDAGRSEASAAKAGLDARLVPVVTALQQKLAADPARAKKLAHLGWALNELLSSGGSVKYAAMMSMNGQPVMSMFDPTTRTVAVSDMLRHAKPDLQAALLAASLQDVYDHLQGRVGESQEAALRRMQVIDEMIGSEDPAAVAKTLDINNPVETGLFESLLSNRMLYWNGLTAIEKRMGHLPTVAKSLEEVQGALRTAERDLAEYQDQLRLVTDAARGGRDAKLSKQVEALEEEVAVIEASVALLRRQEADIEREAKASPGGVGETKLAIDGSKGSIELSKLPIVPKVQRPRVDPDLEPVIELANSTVAKLGDETLEYVGPTIEKLKNEGGRIYFGPTPPGVGAYFSPVTRDLVVGQQYKRVHKAFLATLLIHELKHADDYFSGRSLTRETEHRAFTAMAVFLGAFPPDQVGRELDARNPAEFQAFQWLYSIRRQYLRGKITLEAMVANAYTEMFHAQFAGLQSAAGTLGEFRTRTVLPAKEQRERLAQRVDLLGKSLEAGRDPARERQLRAARESMRILDGLLALYERMEVQYQDELPTNVAGAQGQEAWPS